MSKRNLTDEQICELYKNGERTVVIAEQAGYSERWIRRILERNSIPRRKQGAKRKYSVNEDFFKTWSNEMAWVLGMIVTDGTVVREPKKGVSFFNVVQKESELLEKIKRVINSEHKIVKYQNGNSYAHRFNVSSVKMVKDLIEFGLTPNKSLTVEIPPVPDEFMSHFIRGGLDGDGWAEERGYMANITTASEKFGISVLDVFQSWGLNSYIREEERIGERNIFRVIVNGREDVVKLEKILYKDADGLYYSYKRDRMLQTDQIIEEYNKPKSYTWINSKNETVTVKNELRENLRIKLPEKSCKS